MMFGNIVSSTGIINIIDDKGNEAIVELDNIDGLNIIDERHYIQHNSLLIHSFTKETLLSITGDIKRIAIIKSDAFSGIEELL